VEILVKQSIKKLKAYKPNEVSYDIKLDANEGKNIFFNDELEMSNFLKDINVNFYPDNNAVDLRKSLADYLNIKPQNIIAGNGSSEMIELIIKTFVDKEEYILSPIPSFAMYEVFSTIYSANFIGINSQFDFNYDIDEIIRRCNEKNPKIVFLCNPNNPTGLITSRKEIIKVLENSNSIVVVDEAYVEFSDEKSMVELIDEYENLIVLRTLSKALGLAGIRLGCMISNKKIIDLINKVKSPYNLNALTQYVGIKALEKKYKIKTYCDGVKKERELLYKKLRDMGFEVYRSQGNFLFLKSYINDLFSKLSNKGILIRAFSGELKDFCRISIGDENENKKLVEVLEEIIKNENC